MSTAKRATKPTPKLATKTPALVENFVGIWVDYSTSASDPITVAINSLAHGNYSSTLVTGNSKAEVENKVLSAMEEDIKEEEDPEDRDAIVVVLKLESAQRYAIKNVVSISKIGE